MRTFSLIVAQISVFATLVGVTSAQEISPELFGALPTVSAAEISADGNTIVQIQSDENGQAIAYYDLAGEAAPVGAQVGQGETRGLRWVDPDYAMVLLSASRRIASSARIETYEFWRWIAVNRDTGKAARLFSDSARQNSYFFPGTLHSILPSEPGKALFGHYSRQGEYSLYRVDLADGSAELATRGYFERYASGGRTVDWVVDSLGAPAMRIDYDPVDEERRFYKPGPSSPNWVLASSISEKKEDEIKIDAHGLADAGNLLYASATLDGFRGLHVFDIDKGDIVSSAFVADGLDIDSVIVDPQSAAVIGARFIDDFQRTHFFSPLLQNIQKNLETAIPNSAPEITSWSENFEKFMVRVSYSDHPDQFFLYDHNKKSLSMTAASYAKLDGKVYANKENFDYTSSDGLRIPGYLTIPAGASKENLPLIVLPHGGPFERDDKAFEWWSFFYAARGYLVYQPNFRGSDGYGAEFKNAGFGEWGRKMQDDVTEGVQKLIADGIADPNRICIVGASYGGYAALAGATLTPDIYACSVSVNGISNVAQLLADASGRDGDNDYWKKRVGSRFSDNDALREISPLYNVSSATPPIMLIHSEHDIIVPVGQSRRMRNALRDKGKEHEFVTLKGEDHWLSTGEMRTEMLRASIEFIDRHIGN